MHIAQIAAQPRTERSRSRAAARSSGSAFAAALESLPSSGERVPAQVSGAEPAGLLLSIQEVGEVDIEERRRASRRGGNILDELESLRRDILAGVLTPERLAAVSASLRSRGEAIADPLLRDVMEEIELRAEVELAKWDTRR